MNVSWKNSKKKNNQNSEKMKLYYACPVKQFPNHSNPINLISNEK